MIRWNFVYLACFTALVLNFACKPRLQNGRNVNPQVANAESNGLTLTDSESVNRRNLIAGISMVTQGALQTPPGPGNPEAYGVPEAQNFNPAKWESSFKILSENGLLDLQSDSAIKDTVKWTWSHNGQSLIGDYILERRKIADKRFVLIKLCKLVSGTIPSPTLFGFCGIAEIEASGQLAKSWTLCTGFAPDCP